MSGNQLERYQRSRKIGEGSFGKVYLALDKETNQPVALKVLTKFGRSKNELTALKKEADIHQKLEHPNIIRLISNFETPAELVFVCEFALTDLHKLLAKNGGLGEEWTQRLAHDVISALHYLHLRRILHRDLKPPNILLTSMDRTGEAKVCDFGLSRNMTLETKMLMSIKGTPLYMAPEVLDTKGYGYEADLWSLGCVIFEMLAGEPPFNARSICHLTQMMKFSDVKWPSFLSSACIDFLKRLLVKDPRGRMKWKQIMVHKFVEGKIHIVSGDEHCESAFTNPSEYQQQNEKTQNAAAIMRISKIKQQEAGEDFRSSRESLKVNLNLQSEVEETDAEETFAGKSGFDTSGQVTIPAMNIPSFPNMHQFQLEQTRTHNISNFQPVAENSNMVMHRFMDNVDPQMANLMMIPPPSLFAMFPPANPVQKVTQDLENFSFRMEKSASLKKESEKSQKTQSDGVSTDASSIPVETEEWLQFLFKSMQEILDGDLEIYKQENMMTMIVGLLRESKFSSKIVDHVVQIISLPYAIDMPQSILDDIDQLYLRTKVVPNLVFRSKLLCGRKLPQNSTDLMSIPKVDKLIQFNHSELKTLSSIYDLVCFLVHSGDNFLDMLCDTIALMNLDHVFRSFILSGTNDNSEDGTRLAGSIIALINAILQNLPENSLMIEKIIFHADIDFCKLLNIKDTKLRLRTCLMLRLLGRFCCLSLRNHWRPDMSICLNDLLNDEDESVRIEAANVVEEFSCVGFKIENLQASALEINF